MGKDSDASIDYYRRRWA